MRFHQEKKDKLKAFDNDIDRLKNELEYLKSEDKQCKYFLIVFARIITSDSDRIDRIVIVFASFLSEIEARGGKGEETGEGVGIAA